MVKKIRCVLLNASANSYVGNFGKIELFGLMVLAQAKRGEIRGGFKSLITYSHRYRSRRTTRIFAEFVKVCFDGEEETYEWRMHIKSYDHCTCRQGRLLNSWMK
ncbi:uncharacterized protein LOC131615115 [Vicia villosa]|uniref:uncharacterized protein LOC131615115 n=1 Tax=Vicia villosa TaxID=3911 RepID=UPI00273C1A67|nr:uncharacterized protein LOC131615115 [Vicia villosa]